MNSIFKFARLLSTTILLAMWASSVSAGTYYVSQSGNDTTGKDLPSAFRTIQKCAAVARAGDTCLIRAGTYRETITPTNSGSSGAPITFDAYNGERVVISGANVVPSSSFSVHSGSIYKAPLASLGKGMNQVFMSGAVQSEARFPDVASPGLAYPVPLLNAVWPAFGAFHVEGTTKVTSGLLNSQPAGMWNGGYYSGGHYHNFQFQNADITSSTSGILNVVPLPNKKWYVGGIAENGRGFIYGVLNALNLPGEWVVQGGTLYIKLPTGQTPASTVIEAKARQLAFNLTGKSFINVKKLEVIGAGLMMYGGSNNIIDGTKFSFIHQRSRPTDDGANDPKRTEAGIYLAGRNHTIRNANISYGSGSCVKLLGLNHTVTNSIIHDCAYAGDGSVIALDVDVNTESGTSQRGGHTITHNTLYNSGNKIIIIYRDVQHYFATGRAINFTGGIPTPYLKNMITNNEMYNSDILTRDSGSVYSNGVDGGGTVIANNVIHDNLEAPGSNIGMLVYLDNGTHNFNTHHNVLWMGREGGRRVPFSANTPGYDIMTVAGVINKDPRIRSNNGSLFILNTPGEPGISVWSAPGGAVPYAGKPRIFLNNKQKFNYHGTAAGLTAADFPGGVKFAFGASIAGGGTPIPTDKTVPSIPTGLNGIAASANQVNLTWSASTDNAGGSGVAGYKVYSNGLPVATVTGTSASVTGLAANTSYNFTVASFDNAGNNSAQSAIKAIKTLAGGTAPTGFPVILTGAGPESKSVIKAVTKPAGATSATITLTAFDADNLNEGVLTVNGACPITLFGAQGLAGNNQLVKTLVYTVPASCFVNGNNTLLFNHTSAFGPTAGFRIDAANVAFSGTTPVGLPDVLVTNITYSAGKLTATIKNQGTAATPAGISVNTRYRVDGIDVSFTTIPSLAAGASANVVGQPAFVMSRGSHTVDIKTALTNSSPESNLNNNTLIKTIVVP